MRRWVRVLLAAIGLAAAVYAGASLTGGWLGTPPWWARSAPLTEDEWNARYYAGAFEQWAKTSGPGFPTTGSARQDQLLRWTGSSGAFFPDDGAPWKLARVEAPRHVEPRNGREAISGAIAAVGLALFAWAAWPRRALAASPTLWGTP